MTLKAHYVLLLRKSKHRTYVLSKEQDQGAENHKVEVTLKTNYVLLLRKSKT